MSNFGEPRVGLRGEIEFLSVSKKLAKIELRSVEVTMVLAWIWLLM